MNTVPTLVIDLRTILKKTYNDALFKKLDEVLAGVGVDMQASRHLEIIPESRIKETLKTLAMEMAGLTVLPWCLLVNEELILKSCFSKITIFGEVYYMHSSFYKPNPCEVFITSSGVLTTKP